MFYFSDSFQKCLNFLKNENNKYLHLIFLKSKVGLVKSPIANMKVKTVRTRFTENTFLVLKQKKCIGQILC